jgi:hypothetical protein
MFLEEFFLCEAWLLFTSEAVLDRPSWLFDLAYCAAGVASICWVCERTGLIELALYPDFKGALTVVPEAFY